MLTECERISVSAEEGKLIFDLVQKINPMSLVEVGTGYGYSTSWIDKAKPSGSIFVTLDPDVKEPRAFISAHTTFLRGTLDDYLKLFSKPIDFAFLDSDHQIQVIVKDIEKLVPRLHAGSVIVVHDIDYCQEMGRCLKHYFQGVQDSPNLQAIPIKPSDQRWEYEEIHIDSGIGVATYVA